MKGSLVPDGKERINGETMVRLLFIGIVFIAQPAVLFILYRCRVVSHSWWSDSDLVVFVLPAIAAVSLFTLALRMRWPQPPKSRLWLSLVLVVILTILSHGMGMLAVLNIYGS